MPLLADYQTAVFYPPRLLHTVFSVPVATTIYVLLKLWLCGMTAHLCGRLLGMRIESARFFSLAWMLSSYNLLWVYWPLPDVAAWLPLLFAGTEFVLLGRYCRGFFMTAMAGALLLLAGHPETAFAMGFGVGVYFLLRLAVERRRGPRLWRPVLTMACAWALVLAVCAGQLVPFVEYVIHSSKSTERLEGPGMPHTPARALVSFFVPRFFGTYADGNFWGVTTSNRLSMAYPGIAVCLAAAMAFSRKPAGKTRQLQVLCLSAACLVSLSLAFDAPPLDFVNKVPPFSVTVQSWHISFVAFALALLGAFGIERWLNAPKVLRTALLAVIPVFLGVVCVTVVGRFFGGLMATSGVASYVRNQVVIAALFAAGVLFLLTSPRLGLGRTSAARLLTVLLAADLLVAARGLHPTTPMDELYQDTALTRFLQDLDPPSRVSVGTGGISTGILSVYGIEENLGHDGMLPERMTKLLGAPKDAYWHGIEPMLAIDYYLHHPPYEPLFPLEEPGRFERVESLDGIEVYKNHRSLGRAFLVSTVTTVRDTDALFSKAGDPAFDPAKEALAVAGDVQAVQFPSPGPYPLGTAEVTQRTPLRVAVHVDAAAEGVLVLSDAYYPGWKATVDGAEANVFPVNYALRGVVVPKGPHTVEFHYRPLSFCAGMAMSITALFAGLALAIALLLQGRTQCPAEPA